MILWLLKISLSLSRIVYQVDSGSSRLLKYNHNIGDIPNVKDHIDPSKSD